MVKSEVHQICLSEARNVKDMCTHLPQFCSLTKPNLVNIMLEIPSGNDIIMTSYDTIVSTLDVASVSLQFPPVYHTE